jgi:hypothetical protein
VRVGLGSKFNRRSAKHFGSRLELHVHFQADRCDVVHARSIFVEALKVKALNGGHSEEAKRNRRIPQRSTRGYATGFLDFTRECTASPSFHSRFNAQRSTDSIDIDCSLPQRVIAKNERGHCFDDRHGSWKNTRIVASAGRQRSLLF